ncbi:hypothetical protein HOD75_01945 [archaeon]|jgi:hypothetical protein|nr:hypothetical protein [archaeon]MBT4241639.1 hypothetical protein [archaeon]MBT4418034.1 hypothetical protein [archaeon]
MAESTGTLTGRLDIGEVGQMSAKSCAEYIAQHPLSKSAYRLIGNCCNHFQEAVVLEAELRGLSVEDVTRKIEKYSS